jgi:hypothetical protein
MSAGTILGHSWTFVDEPREWWKLVDIGGTLLLVDNGRHIGAHWWTMVDNSGRGGHSLTIVDNRTSTHENNFFHTR